MHFPPVWLISLSSAEVRAARRGALDGHPEGADQHQQLAGGDQLLRQHRHLCHEGLQVQTGDPMLRQLLPNKVLN